MNARKKLMRVQRLLIVLTTALIAAAAAAAGCAGGGRRQDKSAYETVSRDPRRDSDAAERHNAAAVRRMEQGDYKAAEADLKSALGADVMYGPAHNNLGKVYYHQGKLYLAAWEFQYAAKLMPNVPEPRNNLGLVFESAGKIDEAVASYGEAMNLAPDNVQFIGNLARARVRRGDADDSVRDLLRQLVLRETRPQWADWARERLALMSVDVPQ
jgi:Tfp pilus assembly protein PilF